MDTYAILYLEINLVAVLLVGIIRYKTHGISRMVAQRNFAMAIDSAMLFFISDTYYVMMKCGVLPYHKAAVMASKEIYFFATTLMCFFWFVYFEYMQDSPFVKSRERIWASSVLVWAMGILLIINLFTGILFYVDADNVYQRGPLFILQYILAYIYVFFSSFRAFLRLMQKKYIANRDVLLSLALFPVAPAIAGVLQFIRPDLPLACVALALSALVMYLNWLGQMISVDPLTRLSNRKSLMHTYSQSIQGNEENASVYLLMIDANRFKGINDTYGHIQGDAALVRIADALLLACRDTHCKTHISRYGGDEFVVLAWMEDEEMVADLVRQIHENLNDLNEKAAAPYELTVSIGVAKAKRGIPLKDLIEDADQHLYEEKEKYRNQKKEGTTQLFF